MSAAETVVWASVELQDVAVGPGPLQITFRHAGAYRPVTFTLYVDATRAAEQLTEAMASSCVVHPDSDSRSGWTSAATLQNGLYISRVLLDGLDAHGVADFADPRVDLPLLRSLYEPLRSDMRRSACTLMGRVVRAHRTDGPPLAVALGNTRFATDSNDDTFVYDEAEVEAIEKAAQGVLLERHGGQRDAFAALGFDVSGRGWLRLPAADVIARARQQHPQHCLPGAPQPLRHGLGPQAAWALTHPRQVGMELGNRVANGLGATMRKVGGDLYPDNETLTAALIVHCLVENNGYNASALLQRHAGSLVRLGSDHGLETNVKPRNSSQDTVATRTDSFWTAGGLDELATGLTRFNRHHRRHLLLPDGTPHPVADRLYVEHRPDPTLAKTMDGQRIASGWRGRKLFNKNWPDGAPPRDKVRLVTNGLRKHAQQRAMQEGLTADVRHHGPRTKVHYLANCLSDRTLRKHAGQAQDDMHDSWSALFAHPLAPPQLDGTGGADSPGGTDGLGGARPLDPAADGPEGELANADPDRVVDVEVGVCTNAGQDPDKPDTPCTLGITACFVCPHGFRTNDHVVGLLAADAFSRIVEARDPVEYADGEAARLGFYARACLAAFPKPLVQRTRDTTDLRPHIRVVASMYLEMRCG